MDLQTAVDEVKYRLGNRTDLTERIRGAMARAQSDYLEKDPVLPWFLLTEKMTTTTLAGEERIPVPTDFLREYEFGALWLYQSGEDAPRTALVKDTFDRLTHNMGRGLIDLTGAPEYYALDGRYFRLRPVPDAVYTLEIKVYRREPDALDLQLTQDNNWLIHAPEVLITKTCTLMARHLVMHPTRIKVFEDDHAEALRVLRVDEQARENANARYSMSVSDRAV